MTVNSTCSTPTYLLNSLRKIASLLIVIILLPFATKAQVAGYSFSQTQGTYTPLVGATILATATTSTGTTAIDNVVYTLPNGTIPFTFSFDGGSYTGLFISSNGFITFGSAPAISGSTTGYIPLTAATTYPAAISAMGKDLIGIFNTAGGVVGELSYKVEGVSPSREFVIQWKNFKFTAQSTNTGILNFQIRLQETTNRVRYVYDANGTFNTTSCQVGLRGPNNTFASGNVNIRKVTSGTNTWLTSVAGTDNTATSAIGASLFPATGVTYDYTVNCSWPRNLGFTSSTSSSSKIYWSGDAGATYQVEYGLSGFTLGTGTIISVTDTSVVLSGLAASTSYQFYVRKNCSLSGNGFSYNAGPQIFKTGTTGEDCASAIQVTVATTQASCTSTLVTSGVSANGPFALCSDNTGKSGTTDTWRKFTATSDQFKQMVVSATAGTINDWVMEVWSGCPETPGSYVVACSDDSIVTMPTIQLCQGTFTPGANYNVRMWTYSPTAVGNMSLCIFENGLCALPPANDDCANAIRIPLNPPLSCPAANHMYTDQYATSTTATSACDATTINDVWFKFNTGTSGPFRVNIANGTATGLRASIVFECGSFEVACWNPANGPFAVSGLNPVADYLLRVWSPASQSGTFSVCIEDVCDDGTATLSGNSSICLGDTTQIKVDLTGTAPWGFTWFNGTTNFNVTTSITPYFIKVNPTVSTFYTLVSMNTAICAGTTGGSASVSVIQPPVVTFSAVPNVCSNVVYTLSQGSPIGGVYSGPGITGKDFNAALVGVGIYTITYTYGTGSCASSATQNITVVSAPAITGFSPMIAPIGSLITISGSNFSSVSQVYFNGTLATTVTYLSSSQLRAIVPSGATTGLISINNPNGCSATSTNLFGVGATQTLTTLNLKVYFQGFYQGGGQMLPVLDPANPLVCDSITVLLYSGSNPTQLISTKNGLLSTSGTASFTYPSSIGNTTYYIVVKHRSSLETWSKNPVYFPVGGSLLFDFTSN